MLTNYYKVNNRTRTFSQIFSSEEIWKQFIDNAGLKTGMSDEGNKTTFYLLYGSYGNSHVASSDENRFKYRLLSLMYQYGPTWEKRVEIQKKLRELEEKDLITGSKQISNHALNPNEAPGTSTLEELSMISDQSTTSVKRSKLDAYAMLNQMLETDVTGYYIDRFRELFISILAPEDNLCYGGDEEDE